MYSLSQKRLAEIWLFLFLTATLWVKIKILLTFPDYGGRPRPKDFHKEAVYSEFKKLKKTACRVTAMGMLPFLITEWVNT